jgi:hypothetical protein
VTGPPPEGLISDGTLLTYEERGMSRARDERGRFVSEREEGFGGGILIIVVLLMAVLFLKGVGLLQVWFGIDPYGITLTIDATSVISMALFALLFNSLNTTKRDLAKDFKALEKSLSEIETKLAVLEERTKTK